MKLLRDPKANRQRGGIVDFLLQIVVVLATVAGATYSGLAYHTGGQKISAGQEQLTQLVNRSFSDADSGMVLKDVAFNGLDMDVAIDFNSDESSVDTAVTVNHDLGQWLLTSRTRHLIRKVCRNLHYFVINPLDTRTKIQILGVADSIPIRTLSDGSNRRYSGPSLHGLRYHDLQSGRPVERMIDIISGEPLTLEKLAVLRAYEPSRIVSEELGETPELYAKVLDYAGPKKVVLVIRVVDALKFKYDEMNDLERGVYRLLNL